MLIDTKFRQPLKAPSEFAVQSVLPMAVTVLGSSIVIIVQNFKAPFGIEVTLVDITA